MLLAFGYKKTTTLTLLEGKCRICSETFCCKTCREKHENNEHGIYPDCDICVYGNAVLNKPSNALLEHLKVRHWPLHCVYCQRVFGSVDELIVHRKCPRRGDIYQELNVIQYTPMRTGSEPCYDSPPLMSMPAKFLNVNGLPGNIATSTPTQRNEEEQLVKMMEVITPVENLGKTNNELDKTEKNPEVMKRKVTFCETPMLYNQQKFQTPNSQQNSLDDADNNRINTIGSSTEAFYTAHKETSELSKKETPTVPNTDNKGAMANQKPENKTSKTESQDEETPEAQNETMHSNVENRTLWESAISVSPDLGNVIDSNNVTSSNLPEVVAPKLLTSHATPQISRSISLPTSSTNIDLISSDNTDLLDLITSKIRLKRYLIQPRSAGVAQENASNLSLPSIMTNRQPNLQQKNLNASNQNDYQFHIPKYPLWLIKKRVLKSKMIPRQSEQNDLANSPAIHSNHDSNRGNESSCLETINIKTEVIDDTDNVENIQNASNDVINDIDNVENIQNVSNVVQQQAIKLEIVDHCTDNENLIETEKFTYIVVDAPNCTANLDIVAEYNNKLFVDNVIMATNPEIEYGDPAEITRIINWSEFESRNGQYFEDDVDINCGASDVTEVTNWHDNYVRINPLLNELTNEDEISTVSALKSTLAANARESSPFPASESVAPNAHPESGTKASPALQAEASNAELDSSSSTISVENSQIFNETVEPNSGSGIWNSVSSFVKNVFKGLSSASESMPSKPEFSMKRAFSDNDLADNLLGPQLKRYKYTDIKCRRPIRSVTEPLTEAVRKLKEKSREEKKESSNIPDKPTKKFVDKSTQTDNL